MLKFIGALLATCGMVLLALGVSQSPEVGEAVNALARHVPVDRTTLLLALGALATTVGLGVAVGRRRPPRDHQA